MKQLILITLLVCSLSNTYAQAAAKEAKAAYLLAEEEFSAGKYASAITYLDQAAAKLGTANAKILYLKVLALQMLAQEDEANIEPLKKAIAAFEKAPDFDSFNEEKQLEVMKIKLKLGKEGSLGKSISPLEASVYAKLGITGWQVGVKLEDMKQAHPDFFAQATRTSSGDTAEYYQLVSEQYLIVCVKRGVISYIGKTLKASENDDASYSSGAGLFQELKNYLGGSPEEKITNSSYTAKPAKFGGYNMIIKILNWKNNNTQVSLDFTKYESRAYKTPVSYTSTVSFGVASIANP